MSASEQDSGQQAAGQNDTGQNDTGAQPQALAPHALWLRSARALRHTSILLTYRPPPRRSRVGADSIPATEPRSGRQPSSGSEPPSNSQLAPDAANAARGAASLLDAGLLIVGIVLLVGALITLTQTWVWSWHAGSGTAFTLSRMHGECTSAMGELAQGASGEAASHCLWVDTTWTAVVAFGAAGLILAAFGIVRILRAITKPIVP